MENPVLPSSSPESSSKLSSREMRTLFSISSLTRSISIIIQTVSPIVLVSVLRQQAQIIGWIVAGFWIANALGAVLAAAVIRSRRRSTLFGFILLSVSFAGLALSRNSPTYAAFVILSGLGLSTIQAFLVPSMYLNGSKERPHIGIANYSMALSLGMVAGPLCAAVAILFYGFSILFGILTGVSVAMFVLCLVIGIQRLFEGEDTLKEIKPSSILKIVKNREFANYYALNFLFSMLLPIFISYAGIYAEQRFGLSTSVVLALFAIVFGISTAHRSVFVRSKVAHFKALLISGFLFLVLSFVLIGTATNLPLFLAGFLLFSVPHALIYPTTTFMALETGGKDSVIGTTYLFATSSGIAEFFSPLVAVLIIGLYNLSDVFLLMTPIAIAGIILAFTIPKMLAVRAVTITTESEL